VAAPNTLRIFAFYMNLGLLCLILTLFPIDLLG
jgi:hypothetical protein